MGTRDFLIDAEIEDIAAVAPTGIGNRRGLVYWGICLVVVPPN